MIGRALKILEQSNRPGNVVKRDTIVFKRFIKLLGNPHEEFKSVHVTGTNGKGSATLKIASILEKAGYKTGLFTSPHIFEFVERIKVNNVNIQDDFFSQTIVRLQTLKEKHKLQISFFEYLTAAAFLYFKETKCDWVAIQVGLGGRFDTTNVISPEVSVITSIALDHERILGDTREKISLQKSGIIKENTPVVVGPNAELPLIFEEAKLKKSQVHLLKKKFFETFEDQNRQITREVINVLQGRGQKISEKAIEEGLIVKQPCRMEVVPQIKLPNWAQGKQVIFDVGHNPNAIEKIIEYYNKKLRKSQKNKIAIVFGSSKDKKSHESLLRLEKFADFIYLVSAKHKRAMPIEQLKGLVGFMNHPQKYRVVGDGEIDKAMSYSIVDKEVDTVIIVGSFFIIPEAKGFLNLDQGKLNSDKSFQQNYELKNSNGK